MIGFQHPITKYNISHHIFIMPMQASQMLNGWEEEADMADVLYEEDGAPMRGPVLEGQEQGDDLNQDQLEEADLEEPNGPGLLPARNIPGAIPRILKSNQKITFGTLNMRGRKDQRKRSKMPMVIRLMQQNNLSLLALQETHLMESEVEGLERLHPGFVFILNGSAPNKEGVGYILDKKKLTKDQVVSHEIIEPGRASMLKIEWKKGNILQLLNTHVPNESAVTAGGVREFLKKVGATLDAVEEKEELWWMGDFNLTLWKGDRFPPSDNENKESQDCLRQILVKNELVDGWKHSGKVEIDWTFEQKGAGRTYRSRIDRIYCNRQVMKQVRDWEICQTLPELSDHSVALVELAEKRPIEQRSGYWRMPEDMIMYGPFVKKVKEILLKCEHKMGRGREPAQKIWNETKRLIKVSCQELQRERQILLTEGTTRLRFQLLNKKLETRNDKSNVRMVEIEELEEKINQIERERAEKAKLAGKAKFRMEGEKMSKYYFSLNKPRSGENIISSFEVNGDQIERTEDMAKWATEHHAKLQAKPVMTEDRRKAIRKMRKSVVHRLSNDQKVEIARDLDHTQVQEALKGCTNGKAPGRDGISYEFYKFWEEKFRKMKEGDDLPNILGCLLKVYQDIERTAEALPSFSKGAMFLLYKKGDRGKVENYRPLTLLNTDYKIYTKMISIRLGKVAGTLINKDQAGFVPGRSIYDQIKLAKLMVPFAEQSGENGVMVSLDQEKAYDRIDHDYLWRIMIEMGFPVKFVTTIQALYRHARTAVVVNGMMKHEFEVCRGVRQGDPMSCLLFDLAIEPLANRLRSNKKLNGYMIGGERLVVNMFADDTIVFLSSEDKIKHMIRTLDEYCLASTARFNLNKTNYIPIGERRFRESFEQSGTMWDNGRDTVIEKEHIMGEGRTTRLLGAWIGNGGSVNEQWDKILDESQEVLERWGRSYPSLPGKVLVINTLVASRAWYLAMVNEMPGDYEERMRKMFHSFLWNGKRNGSVTWEVVKMKREDGGLGLVDVRAKLDTMQLIWARGWLDPSAHRPRWAYVADKLIAKAAAKTPMTSENSRINWALQSWKVIKIGRGACLPVELKNMIMIAERYCLRPDGIRCSERTKGDMPVAHHYHANNRQLENRKSGKCLIEIHGARKMKDLLRREADAGCKRQSCIDLGRKLLEGLPVKWRPGLQDVDENSWALTVEEREVNKRNWEANRWPITFDPDVTENGDALSTIRVFGGRNVANDEVVRAERGINNGEKIVVYTDGSSLDNGTANARSGAGIWVELGSVYNRSIRVPGREQSNQRAEVIAVMEALRVVPQDQLLEIHTDSRYVIDGICKYSVDWENKGWVNVLNSDVFRVCVARLRSRRGRTYFKWVKGHSGNPGNEMADELAGEGAQKEEIDFLDMEHNELLLQKGARLHTLSFSDIYAHLRSERRQPEVPERIADAQREVEAWTGIKPTAESVWASIRLDPIPKNVGDFIWKLAHDKLPMGKNVMHYAQGEEWAKCKRCGSFETPEHMLFACASGQAMIVWAMAREFWQHMGENMEWREPSISLIIGMGAVKIMREDGSIDAAATQLWKTIISVSIWTVWTLRCKLVMAGEDFGKESHKTIWREAVRLSMGVDLMIRKKYLTNKVNKKKWSRSDFLIQKNPLTGKDREMAGRIDLLGVNL